MMNEDFEKVIYVEKIVYKRAIPEYQKRAFKKYIESDKGRVSRCPLYIYIMDTWTLWTLTF